MHLFIRISVVLATLWSLSASMKWSDCGPKSSDRVIRVLSVELSPSTIHIPGKETLTMEVQFLKPPKHLDISLNLKKKAFFIWIPIPCIDGIGSCTYRDVCSRIGETNPVCPEWLVSENSELPCTCDDIRAAKYKIDHKTFLIPKLSGLVAKLASGKVKLTISLKDREHHDKTVGCVSMETKVTT